MKKILILGGASVHCKLVEAAKNLGCYTIVTDYLTDSPAKRIADESWNLNIMDVNLIVNKCKKKKIDAVISGWLDPCQKPYNEICERLNLPCYGTAEQFRILTDKNAFKSFCKKCNIDTIPQYSVLDVQKGDITYPVFVKPDDSRGSRGQSICYTYDELMTAIAVAKNESSNDEVVIEKYMEDKQDFSITYFVIDGVPHLIRICDRYLGEKKDNLNRQCIGCIAPSKYTQIYLNNVDCRIKAFIKKLGIMNGPVFMQGFIDGDTVRFYDPGLRFPGGDYELFLKMATSVDLMELLVEFALTGKISRQIDDDLFKLNGKHSVQLDFACRKGKITLYHGIEEINKNVKVVSAFKRYELGEVVPNSGDVRQRVYEIGMLLEYNDSIAEAVKEVQSIFNVLDEHGNSMLISQLNSDLLFDYN
ncbi:MAG: hypothetical protein NC320_05985 [Clostridium sp.]|nr:hypothetical protein [Clostridium sp.]